MGFYQGNGTRTDLQNQPRNRNQQRSSRPPFALPPGYPTPLEGVTGGDTSYGTSDRRWCTWRLMACCRFLRRFFLSRSSLIILPMMSGLFLFCIALHDGFLFYLSLRRGVANTYSLAWSLPWMTPTARTMLRFGAFSPQQWIISQEYWRSLSAMVATSSLGEWVLILLAWRWGLTKTLPSTTHIKQYSRYDAILSSTPIGLLWPLVYVLSALTGQLWMMAFTMSTTHIDGVSGCSGWGTAGVICAMGMLWPERRFGLFLLAIAFVLLNLVQAQTYSSSTGCLFGIIGASCFGWSWCGMWLPPISSTWEQHAHPSYDDNDDDNNSYDNMKSTSGLQRPSQISSTNWGCWNIISIFVVVSAWLLPILYMCYGY